MRLELTLMFVLGICIGCGESSGPRDERGLDERIDNALSLYLQAREKIIDRVVIEEAAVARPEWEAWLAPDAEQALSEGDLNALRQRHEEAIEDARAAAAADPIIDVDAFRHDAETAKHFCTELPKGGMLHIHPGGTRTIETVEELLATLDPLVDGVAILEEANDGELTMLYANEVVWLEALPVARYSDYGPADQKLIAELLLLPEDPPTHDFMRFEAVFSIGHALLRQDESMDDWVAEKTLLNFAQRAVSLGVSYVEFTKVVIPPSREALDRLNELSLMLEQETGLIARWNLAFVRTISGDSNGGWAQDLIALLGDGPVEALVGIDLLGDETDTPALETGQAIYLPVLDAVQHGRIDLRRTMHAGELGDPQNVRDAFIMGAERVGHGVRMASDPLTLEYAQRERLPVAINLVSNWQLQVWQDFATHPFLDYLRLGLPVSLSTDDEGILRTEIANECWVAVQNTDIQYVELAEMARNSIAGGFMDDDLRNELMADLEIALTAFEASWSRGPRGQAVTLPPGPTAGR